MSDRELDSRLRRLAAAEGRFTAVLLSHLAEFDRRRLAGAFGQPSLFYYCVRVLGFSEGAAYKRIQAARAVRDFPELLEGLASGGLNLAAVVVLSPHLTRENVKPLLAASRGKSIRELEVLTAAMAPRSDAPDMVRALPPAVAPEQGPEAEPSMPALGAVPTGGVSSVAGGTGDPGRPGPLRTAATAASAAKRPEPLSGRRFLFRFTGGRSLLEKYEKSRALLAGRAAGAGMEVLFEAALDALLGRIDRSPGSRRRGERSPASASGGPHPPKSAAGSAPRRSRRIPRGVKDAVWRRDGGRCTYVGVDGGRCPESVRLEYDHIIPWAEGGRSDDESNLRLACRTHNLLEARRHFGDAAIDSAIESRRARRRQPRGPEGGMARSGRQDADAT